MLQSKPCKFGLHLHAKSQPQSNYRSIRKNAATSPLLLLPSEVRENILIHLLGDKFIHVKYLDLTDIWRATKAKKEHSRIGAAQENESEELSTHAVIDVSESNDEKVVIADLALATAIGDPTGGAAFRHAICVATQSEQSAYDEFVSGDAHVPKGESPEHYVAPCKKRHVACKMCGNGPMYLLEEDRPALRVDLNMLGVCRQLYEEGNHLLWATNTFSFEDPRTFGKFFGSLNPAQKRKLARIHISADMIGFGSYGTTAYERARYDNNYWGKVLKMANLNMLRGVQTLHLCLNQTLMYAFPRINTSADRKIETAMKEDLETLLRLGALSTRHVTVIVSDDPRGLKQRLSWRDLRWTAVEKAEYAETIRARLLDPNGAELVKAETEAASLARKVENRDKAADRLFTYKSILRARRADMVWTSKLATREEAKAILAAEELARPSSKTWKKAAELQRAADDMNERLLDAREDAEFKARLEKHWHGEVADAREKLKRAMAQLGSTPEGIEYEEELEKLMESSSDSEMDVISEDSDDDLFSR